MKLKQDRPHHALPIRTDATGRTDCLRSATAGCCHNRYHL